MFKMQPARDHPCAAERTADLQQQAQTHPNDASKITKPPATLKGDKRGGGSACGN
jgi:hypothetical protein